MAEAATTYDDGLTDEERLDIDRDHLLEVLGVMAAESRSAAIAGREQCRIETQWEEDDAFYQGVDAASAGDYIQVGDTVSAPVTESRAGTNAPQQTRSTLFLNITRPFTDAAAARFGDALIPQDDDRSFSIQPTPIPDQIAIKDKKVPLRIRKQVQEAMPDDPEAQKRTIDEIIAAETQKYQEASERCERARRQIDDWLVECNYHGHVRRLVDEAARLGTGVLKGPEPYRQTQMFFLNGKTRKKTVWAPGARHVSVKNCYPDPIAGEDIQNGSFHWERDWMTARQLRKLAGQPGVLNSQLAEVLREGAHVAVSRWDSDDRAALRGLQRSERRDLYEVWRGYMAIPAEDAAMIDGDVSPGTTPGGLVWESQRRREMELKNREKDIEDADEGDTTERDEVERGNVIDLGDQLSRVSREDAKIYLEGDIDVKVLLVNNRIVRIASNPLSEGKFPYYYFAWQRIPGLPYGKGVPRQMRGPQRMVLAAVRNMLDNAGYAAGMQLIVDADRIEPVDGQWVMTARKLWKVKDGVAIDDVRKAMTVVKLDMMQQELQAILMLGMRLAEDASGLPALLQGQMGKAPDTVGGMNILNDNANAVIRRIARNYDDSVTDPSIRAFYDYLLLHVDDDNMKGDMQVDVTGSAMMVAREWSQALLQEMLAKSENPVFGLDPKKVAAQWLKANRFDVRLVKFTDDKWRELVEQMTQMAAAKPITDRAQLLQLELEHKSAENQKDRELKSQIAQMELDDNAEERTMKATIAAVETDLKRILGEYRRTGDEKKMNSEVALTAMRLRSQERLSRAAAADHRATPEVATPPTEPAGLAAPGEAYQA